MKTVHKLLLLVALSFLGATYAYLYGSKSVDWLSTANQSDKSNVTVKRVSGNSNQTVSTHEILPDKHEVAEESDVDIRVSKSVSAILPASGSETGTVDDSGLSLLNPFSTDDVNPSAAHDSAQATNAGNQSRSNTEKQNSLTDNLIAAALDDDLEASSSAIGIEFSYSALGGTRFLPNPVAVGLFDTAYAHVMPFQKCENCIFKWQHQATGGVEILEIVALAANQSHTIFITPEEGWKIGSYIMSVYDAKESNELLGRGEILITAVNAETLASLPDSDFLQSLLDSGRARSKSRLFSEDNSVSEVIAPNHEFIQDMLISGQATPKTK